MAGMVEIVVLVTEVTEEAVETVETAVLVMEVMGETEVMVGRSLGSPDPSPRASACSTVRYTSTLLTGKTLCVNFRVGKGTGPSACKG